MFCFCWHREFDRRYISEFRVPGFGCWQQKLKNSTSGAQGMALECRINNFYIYTFYCNPMLWRLILCLSSSLYVSVACQLTTIKAVFVFVGVTMLIIWSGRSHLLLMGMNGMLSSFVAVTMDSSVIITSLDVTLQMVRAWCQSYCYRNRLDLVMTDAPNITDVSVTS